MTCIKAFDKSCTPKAYLGVTIGIAVIALAVAIIGSMALVSHHFPGHFAPLNVIPPMAAIAMIVGGTALAAAMASLAIRYIFTMKRDPLFSRPISVQTSTPTYVEVVDAPSHGSDTKHAQQSDESPREKSLSRSSSGYEGSSDYVNPLGESSSSSSDSD